jgi:hypothetical protein
VNVDLRAFPPEREKERDMTITMTEPITEARNEWNHSCTAQCPNPCPAANVIDLPEITIPDTPEMLIRG